MAAPNDMLRVTCLPVGHGDCLLVEYGDADVPYRILIDGGPAHTYPAVREALDRLPADQRDLELLVITHIDADHIDGALILLQDEALGLSFQDIWFNGWPQLESPDAPEVFGPQQGAFLESLLHGRPWNVAFGGGPIVVDDEGELPVKRLPGGAELILLSPRPRALRRLRASWRKVLQDAGMQPGDWKEAARRLAARRRYEPPAPRDDVFAARAFGSDRAVPNGSSIAFVLRYEGHAVLLAADAHASVLVDGLQRMAADDGDRRKLDAVKLSHHGSMSNVSGDLLDAVACSCFLVSTNGDHFDHPDPETIGLVGEHATDPILRFNHRSRTTAPWTDPVRQAQDGINAVFPPEGLIFTAGGPP